MGVTDVVLSVSGGISPGLNDSCMVGQYNVGTISAGSYLVPANGSNWSFGFTGLDYLQRPPDWGGPEPAVGSAASPPDHVWIPISGGLTSANDSEQWFAATPGTETITATATAYASGVALGTVTAQYTMTAMTTYNNSLILTPGTASDGALSLTSGDPGMTMDYTVNVPSQFINSSGSGYVMMGQLTDFYQDVVPGIGPNTSNGWALDNSFQYGNFAGGVGVVLTALDSDTPNQPHSPAGTTTISDQYQSFAVYYPPANGVGQEFVPVAEQDWTWNTSDTYPPYHAVASPVPGAVASDPMPYFWWTQVYHNPFGR